MRDAGAWRGCLGVLDAAVAVSDGLRPSVTMQYDDSVVMEFYCRGGIDGFFRLVHYRELRLYYIYVLLHDAEHSQTYVVLAVQEHVVHVFFLNLNFASRHRCI